MIKYVVTVGKSRIEFADSAAATAYKNKTAGATGPVSVESNEQQVVEVPQSQPAWRIKSVCALMGLVPLIDSVIAGLPEPDKTVATIAWSMGGTVERTSPLVSMIQAAAQLTDAEADQIFIQASALNV